jgi:hemerythrin
MALVSWTDGMSVGIAKIDSEHRGLIDIINQLHSEMLAGKSKDAMRAILDRLIAYTKTHFATEEMLFRTHGYPQAVEHMEEHASLTQKALVLQADLKVGKVVISAPVLDFLRNWLTSHILKDDMAYRLFFASKGVR